MSMQYKSMSNLLHISNDCDKIHAHVSIHIYKWWKYINAKRKETISQDMCAFAVHLLVIFFRVNFPRRNISIHLYCFVFFSFFFASLILCLFFVYYLHFQLSCDTRSRIACRYDTTTKAMQSNGAGVRNFCRTLLIIPLTRSRERNSLICVQLTSV